MSTVFFFFSEGRLIDAFRKYSNMIRKQEIGNTIAMCMVYFTEGFQNGAIRQSGKNGEKSERSISQSISHSQAGDTATIDGRETMDHALETDELMKASHCFLSDYSFLCYHGNRGVVQIDSSRGLFTHKAPNCGVFVLFFVLGGGRIWCKWMAKGGGKG